MEFRRTHTFDGPSLTTRLYRLNIEGLPHKDVFLAHHKAGKSYTTTGYGSKIPTTSMVQYDGRWRRIYCVIYSNSGTLYIIHKGEKVVVNGLP